MGSSGRRLRAELSLMLRVRHAGPTSAIYCVPLLYTLMLRLVRSRDGSASGNCVFQPLAQPNPRTSLVGVESALVDFAYRAVARGCCRLSGQIQSQHSRLTPSFRCTRKPKRSRPIKTSKPLGRYHASRRQCALQPAALMLLVPRSTQDPSVSRTCDAMADPTRALSQTSGPGPIRDLDKAEPNLSTQPRTSEPMRRRRSAGLAV